MTPSTEILLFSKYIRPSTCKEDREFDPMSSPGVEIREKGKLADSKKRSRTEHVHVDTVYASVHRPMRTTVHVF